MSLFSLCLWMMRKPLWIPFERYRYDKKRLEIERDIAFRSSDDLVILLRKLPERCKTRPSKLCCNSSFCPFVSKFGRWVYAYSMYLNPKIHRGLGNICGWYSRYSPIPLPNVTTNMYIIFQIFCMPYQGLSNGHSWFYSIYAPITCVILVTEPWGTGVLDMYTRELQLSSRSATRTYLHFSHSSSHHG